MSDQSESIETLEATPDTGTPEPTETPSQEEKDVFEQRYKELRPVYDRTQNELHRYQNDPVFREQLFRELATEFDYELDAGDEEYDESDPDEALRRELQELKQWKEGFVEQQTMQQQAAIAERYSESRMTELGLPDDNDRSLSKEDREMANLQRHWIVTRAMALPHIQDEDGNIVPDIDLAYREYRRIVPEAPQARPEVPFTPQGGQENTGVPAWPKDPIAKREAREALMLQRLEQQRNSA